MGNAQTFVHRVGDMQAEKSTSDFATLLREEGDQIRRDVFTMVSPEQSASGRILSGYTVIYPGCRTRGHSHADREEVYYFIKGSGIMVVDDEEMAVTAGDTLYLKPGPFHATINTTDFPFEFFWITIKVD
jgi:oxalate decarboxylase/phosphoglucose isomerase-like protein (cupin superfamily)